MRQWTDRATGTALAWSGVVLSWKRPVRYLLRAPVLYRVAGEERWREGVTVNVSQSGVLVTGDLPAACAEPVAVVIALPTSTGCLTGWGRIARVAHTAPQHEPSTFAIAVPQFSLERQAVALSRLRTLHQEC